ncbi:MAG: hypothetical protein QOG85_2425 [Gaiellaceae bacterium]|nr:hypothetical protein [Gaiellaceae bacterium]
MRVTFNRSGNSAYIYLKEIVEGEAVRQHHVDEPHARGMFILDFDKKGRLIGIEILDATKALPPGLLDKAERI